ncbi:sulfate transporter family-domain-containing protein [Paraphysoderma sedebokerense]|nr:sulfate transporter family-domain-containing protein [Paraphysoderma sedebokerense]
MVPPLPKDKINSMLDSIRSAPSTIPSLMKAPGKYVAESFSYYRQNPLQLKTEILSGISITFLQVPESIAFAWIAGVTPLMGLQSTFMMCLIAGLFGTVSMINGVAGAMVVVMDEITSDEGVLKDKCFGERLEYLYTAIFVCGCFQVLMGLFNVTRFIKLIPQSVMVGFLNGLSIIITQTQLSAFRVREDVDQIRNINSFNFSSKSPDFWANEATAAVEEQAGCPDSPFRRPYTRRFLRFDELEFYLVLIIVVVAMFITYFQPRIKKRIQIGRYFTLSATTLPPALVAMVVALLIEHVIYRRIFRVGTKTISEIASVTGPFVKFNPPNLGNLHIWIVALKFGIQLAMIGLIETVLGWKLCQRIMNVRLEPSKGTQEAYGQGIGNIVSSMFRLIGGSVLIGQTVVNVLNGSKGKLSSLVAAATLMLLTSFADGLIGMIPTAGLTGILFVVVIHTFEWRTFKWIFKRQIPVVDMISIIAVTVIAVLTDLAIAVIAGVVWSAVAFAWNNSNRTQFQRDSLPLLEMETLLEKQVSADKTQLDEKFIPLEIVTKRFQILGPLYYAVADEFTAVYSPSAFPSLLSRTEEPVKIVAHTPEDSASSLDDSSNNSLAPSVDAEATEASDKKENVPLMLIVFDFGKSCVSDLSGLSALKGVAKEWIAVGADVKIIGLDKCSRNLCKRSTELKSLILFETDELESVCSSNVDLASDSSSSPDELLRTENAAAVSESIVTRRAGHFQRTESMELSPLPTPLNNSQPQTSSTSQNDNI